MNRFVRFGRHALFALPLASSLLWGACSGNNNSSGNDVAQSSEKRQTAPDVSDANVALAATGERDFGVNVYTQLVKANSKDNLFLSPHSIAEALTMVYAGAAGNTATQLRAALQAQLPDSELHAAMNGLDLQLVSRGQGQQGVNGQPFTLRVANALWGQNGFTFEPTFLDTIALNYGAGVHLVNFATATEAARTTINNWVADETDQKILNLIPVGGLNSDTVLTITNAVYFNASWAVAFAASATTNDSFTKLDSTTENVPTMHGTVGGQISTASGGPRVASIPYAGNQLSMIIIQPSDLPTFEASLTGDSLETLITGLTDAQIELSLPKWTFTNALDLAQSLNALGVTDAFKQGIADFSGIDGRKDLFIQDVLHKAYIAVDESGTEAAAATSITIGTSAVVEPTVITIDGPFLYLIRDNATGAVVFIGRVTDPAA